MELNWQEPENNGGSPIKSYELQISNGGSFATVFEGLSLKHTINQLIPQTTYKFQVRSKNESGYSEWSKPTEITTKQPSSKQN